MARPLRIEYPGACYHVLNRGNQQQLVFRQDEDYRLFLDRLKQFAETFGIEVRSYCLMPNHFHLYLRTREANLSRFMQSLLTSFTIIMNRRYERSGHIFQGRFKSWVVEDEAYGSRLSRYLHLNPIRVEGAQHREADDLLQELRRFRWSSYAAIIGHRRCPRWLDREAVLRTWGRSLREQQQHYMEYVESGLLKNVEDPLEAEVIHGVLGSEGFMDKIRRLAAGAASGDSRECLEAARLQATFPLERVIEAVCEAYGEERAAVLRRYNRGCEARQVLLYLATIHCRGRATLAELAKQLGPISLGALTRARQKLSERLQTDKHLKAAVTSIEASLCATQAEG